MNLFKNDYFYAVVCDHKTIETTYCLTLDFIDSCKALAKQGHHVSIKKYRVPS